jgi:hypothetical protein
VLQLVDEDGDGVEVLGHACAGKGGRERAEGNR